MVSVLVTFIPKSKGFFSLPQIFAIFFFIP